MRVMRMTGPGGGWRVLVPETRSERMRGFRRHPPPAAREAMMFPRCRGVQTFGMASAITVAFLDADLRVVEVRVCPPRRLVLGRGRARHVLECDPRAGLRVGDRFRP